MITLWITCNKWDIGKKYINVHMEFGTEQDFISGVLMITIF